MTALLTVAVAVPTAAPGPHSDGLLALRPISSVDASGGGRAPCALPSAAGLQMAEGIPTRPGYSRSLGAVRALTLMVDFPDARGEGPARRRFDEFFPRTSRWFARSSYGRLRYRPAAPVPRWLRMPRPFRAYGIQRGSRFEPGYRRLVRDLAAAADPHVDFRRYDFVNVLVTPNAGPRAVRAVLSVTFAGNPEAPSADGVPLANVSFIYSRQDDGSGSYARTGYRVLPHENGHVFGLPDLYTPDGGGLVGHWDVMSEDWGADNDLLAWHKWKLGWITGRQVDCAARPGTSAHTLRPTGRPGGTKLVFVPLSRSTGYAVEARTESGNDSAVCRPGVLVSRVDTAVDSGGGPVQVVDATPGSRGCTREPNVHPGLSDATYRPGETFTDRGHGVMVRVDGIDARGDYRLRVSRLPSAGGRD